MLQSDERLPFGGSHRFTAVTTGDCLTGPLEGLWQAPEGYGEVTTLTLPAGSLSPFLVDPDALCAITVDVTLEWAYVSGERTELVVQYLSSAVTLQTVP